MRKLFVLVLSLGMLAVAGCGGGNDGADGLVGGLTVTSTQSQTDTTGTVSFTIKYTNPYRTDMVGVPLNYVITSNGALVDDVATNFSTSGVLTVSYIFTKDDINQNIKCVAQTGSLVASSIETVTAYGTLAISPLTATFEQSIGAQLTYTASGGLPPYTFDVTPSAPGLVSSVAGASSITLTRLLESSGTVTITVYDSDGNNATAEARLEAFVP